MRDERTMRTDLTHVRAFLREQRRRSAAARRRGLTDPVSRTARHRLPVPELNGRPPLPR
jgi:hypothetical protein